MLPETTVFNSKHCEVIDRCLLISKIKFLWGGEPDFRERQVENRERTGKYSISQGFGGEFLPFVLE